MESPVFPKQGLTGLELLFGRSQHLRVLFLCHCTNYLCSMKQSQDKFIVFVFDTVQMTSSPFGAY